MRNLFYFQDPKNLNIDSVFFVYISKDLNDKRILFEEYAEKLFFPSYFGKNWNALEDCLADLSNIQERNIIIIHEDLPFAKNHQNRINYLEILITVIELWQNYPEHKLYVYFPSKYKNEIETIITQPDFGN